MGGPRRILAILCLLSAIVSPARAADPARGTVSPGRNVSWTGQSYAVAANDTGECDEPIYPCDVFTLNVNVAPSYWKGRGGGIRIAIDDFGSNDFDVFVYHSGEDGGDNWYSVLPAGYPEDIFIREASGRYEIVVIPYRVVNSAYRGSVTFVSRPKKPPTVRTPGVRSTPVARGPSYFSPSVAIDPGNAKRAVLAVETSREATAAIFRSADGGTTWRRSESLPGYQEPSPFRDSYDVVWAPSVVAGSSGEFLMVVQVDSNDGRRLNVHRSDDGGATWSDPSTIVHLPMQFVEQYDFNIGYAAYASLAPTWLYSTRVTASGQNALACWIQPVRGGVPAAGVYTFFGPGAGTFVVPSQYVVALMASRSTDGGRTWSPPLPVSVPGTSDQLLVSPTSCKPAVSADGAEHVLWTERSGTVKIASAAAGLPVFEQPVTVASATLPATVDGLGDVYPVVDAAVASDGAISAVFVDHEANDLDVLLTRSSDGGATWSEPVRVNDDRRKPRDQYLPAIAVAPSGATSVFFYDRRNDPGNYYWDAYVAHSRNGTKFTNVRLSSKMFEATESSPFGEYPGWGSHQGIAVSPGATIVAWVDRQWEPPPARPRPGPGPIPIPPSPRSSPWGLWSARISTPR